MLARFQVGHWVKLGARDLGIVDSAFPAVGERRSATRAETSPLPASPVVIDLNTLPAVECPCGEARRAFADRSEFPGTVHLTHISRDAREHYHREHTEIYIVLECGPDAAIELDGERRPVAQQTAVLIPPGTRHRACGEMKVLILCTPNFDPADEHFD